jgi:hypothetical protein
MASICIWGENPMLERNAGPVPASNGARAGMVARRAVGGASGRNGVRPGGQRQERRTGAAHGGEPVLQGPAATIRFLNIKLCYFRNECKLLAIKAQDGHGPALKNVLTAKKGRFSGLLAEKRGVRA